MLEYEYPDLKPLTVGASFSQVIQTLHAAHLLRYSTQEHLKTLGSWKIATKKKLQTLADLGYLVKNEQVFTSTRKTLDLLIKQGYKRELLPPHAEGRGAEIYNSDALVKIIRHPFYKQLLYPHFEYVIPDGLLILQDGDRYQLNFIEVEVRKPKWAEYLEDKRQKYERLARDEQVFRYWAIIAPFVGLKCPRINDFKFQVVCVGDVHFEWEGWRFIK